MLVGLLALGALVGGLAAVRYVGDVGLKAFAVVPVAALLALVALSLAGRAAAKHQRTLGRAGGRAATAAARGLSAVALILAATAAVAFAFFVLLRLTQ